MKENSRELYLDLMKKCLVNWIYGNEEYVEVLPTSFLKREIVEQCQARQLYLMRLRSMVPELRNIGRDYEDGFGYPQAHTMIGLKRLDNIKFCIESILSRNIPGDLIECGVWHGGAVIFKRAMLKAYGVTDRLVWVADSFEGCPPPDEKKYPHDKGVDFYQDSNLAVTIDKVKANFDSYGLLDNQVCFLKGWFKDTLPKSPIQRLALLRVDGDLYESTMDVLFNLYPKLSKGGYAIIDDYNGISACKKAVNDYRELNNIKDDILEIDKDSIYWQKS